ncbi:uncharacterized protein Z518_01095 [Rhinocladiella mackenziei CBS 650.93]|uniref:Uncharacterized protein n=1 Tax=Rhinocladiella mackenziei CBS 650.93 TaxID=1442369 RepID=A0A0D2IVG0_9EURO|nr:uncharacterized protein Z518_01095 [Rhinocladiella mackenziei CBS 650.93]KIX10014.1 hypothetical protein Z518_01095 [Rhinocladiella mackenziei CBS 650.93]
MSPTKSSLTTSNPLNERSPNTSSPTKSKSAGKMDETFIPRFEHHAAPKQMVNPSQNQNRTYISPSDAITSPTTKKLSEIKGRRFMNTKPQTLFAKTLAKEISKPQPPPPDRTKVKSEFKSRIAGQHVQR